MSEAIVDLPMLRALKIACRHCGNIVVKRGKCPMYFPLPDCLTDEAAADLSRQWTKEKQP